MTNDILPEPQPEYGAGTALRLARISFLGMVALLAWMKYPLNVGGLPSYPSDYLFVVSVTFWIVALGLGQTSLRWHRAYWLLIIYFVAIALSCFQSADLPRSLFKLLTQAYLLSLPVVAFNLFRTLPDLRKVAQAFVAGAAAVAAIGMATLLLFPLLGRDSVLAWSLHHFGTLSPGSYPRLELTFEFPAMLVSYLTAALAFLLAGTRVGWFTTRAGWLLGGAVFLSALFALTPGFGGVLFVLGAWIWYCQRTRSPSLARAALLTGCLMPIVGAIIAAVTPILHPTAPFLIHVPGLPHPLAPSVRLLAWIEATHNFLGSPLFGHGIGIDAVQVIYMQKDLCWGLCVTDAHNTFLSIAVQTGIAGLAAIMCLIAFVAGNIKGSPPKSQGDVILFGLAIGWISGFALQGLVGSFEDSRHLWIVFGVMLSALCLSTSAEPEQRT